MLGKDFYVFWQIGRAILEGLPFYSVPESLYPPATLFFFIPLGIFPFPLAYAIWSGLNVVLYILSIRVYSKENPIGWFFFTPTIFILMTGQNDILFLWFSTFLKSDQVWKRVLGAAFLTLKPQVAFIVLPWTLIRWIREQPKTFLYWVASCLVIHGFPLIFDSSIYSKWLNSTQPYSENRMLLSPGLFGLTNFSISVWVISIFAIAIIIFGLIKTEAISRTSQILALPLGIWYENVFLLGSVSWKWLVPISWACFFMAYFLRTSAVLIFIPFIVMVFQIINLRRINQ